MDIRISGHQVDTGEALQEHVNSRLASIAEKYFSRAISSHVTFRRAPHGAFHCDIICHVMSGLILKGAGEAQDAHICFDQAADRIEKQLRRYMRRLKDRHVQAAAAEAARNLRNTNALLFVNAGTSAYNMVYRRHDGSIGWVEPRA